MCIRDRAEGIKVLARAHQSAVWGRQRQVNALRSALREYYPAALEAFGTNLSHHDAVAVLSVAPTPALGRQLSRSKIASALRRGGRSRNVETKAEQIQNVLRAEHLEAPPVIAAAYGNVARSALRLIEVFTTEIAALELAVAENFEQHPDAKICLLYTSSMVTDSMTTFSFGVPDRVPMASMDWTTSPPETTAPNSEYWGGNEAPSAPLMMKNWLPLVFGPALAIASRPALSMGI